MASSTPGVHFRSDKFTLIVGANPIKARFTKDEVNRLMRMVGNPDIMSECTHLYRNKSENYFNQILAGDGIMKPYIKDNSGDPRNPINGNIKGLFFMASVLSGGKPIGESPFGSRRCLIPVDKLVNPVNHNLYFSDYFCMRGRRHYVTFVITRKNSMADEFCVSRLPLLNMRDNTFFRCSHFTGKFCVNSSDPYLLIEICYTENVDLKKSYVIFENVPIAGKGSSTAGGIPKNAWCDECNLRG